MGDLMQVDIIKIEKAIYHEEKKDKVLVGIKDPLILSKIYKKLLVAIREQFFSAEVGVV
jgi:hypothetical protein